jgi:hypothetical protein
MTVVAAPWADSLRTLVARDTTVHAARIWILGSWEAANGDTDAAEQILALLTSTNSYDETNIEVARLRRTLYASLEARIAAARGDTARALSLLARLVPTGSTTALRWSPWESFGPEQVTYARLLLENGAAAAAARVARRLEAPAAIPYVQHLSASLEIREHAARVQGYVRLANQLRHRRLTQLGHQ